VRSGATVRRFSAQPGARVQRCAVPDAAPWPDAAAAEPDGTPVRKAALLREAGQGEPWRGVTKGEPCWGVSQDGPWRRAADGPWLEATQVGPLMQGARAFFVPGHQPRCSLRSRRRSEEMLQNNRHAKA
jgi:hypothetical protein